MPDLSVLGWDPTLEQSFAAFRSDGLLAARVVTEDKLHYTVVGADGERLATIAGRLLHQSPSRAALPKVGDWVAIEPLAGETKAIIHAVLPRRTKLSRKLAGRDLEEQVLAANVDVAFLVQALDITFNLRKLERALLMTLEGGIAPVVVLNKTDLCKDLAARTGEAQAAAGTAPVLAVCARTGRNVRALLDHVPPGRTAVFVGPSGVGKSSLINRLCGEPVQPTLEVRAADQKGRHSTTWRELIPLPGGGIVVDTPGMREFHLWHSGDGAENAFPDIEELALRCHFRGCTHTAEKRCAVLAAVQAGTLDTARLESYRKLKRELDYVATEAREHTFLARKRDARVRSRSLDKFLREKYEE